MEGKIDTKIENVPNEYTQARALIDERIDVSLSREDRREAVVSLMNELAYDEKGELINDNRHLVEAIAQIDAVKDATKNLSDVSEKYPEAAGLVAANDEEYKITA